VTARAGPELSHPEIRATIARLRQTLSGDYWRKLDHERTYPKAFVDALTREGYLSVPIPEEYGGSGLGLGAATAILEEIHRSGCNGAACHAQMYTMGAILRHGSPAQKAEYLPKIARGELHLQAFAATEPTSCTDTTRNSDSRRSSTSNASFARPKLNRA
jgi:acyl-CoA dehydrogenase